MKTLFFSSLCAYFVLFCMGCMHAAHSGISYERSAPTGHINDDTPLARWNSADVIVLARIIDIEHGKAGIQKVFKGPLKENVITIVDYAEPLEYYLNNGDEAYLFLQQHGGEDEGRYYFEDFDDVAYLINGVVLDYFRPAAKNLREQFLPTGNEYAKVWRQDSFELEIERLKHSNPTGKASP